MCDYERNSDVCKFTKKHCLFVIGQLSVTMHSILYVCKKINIRQKTSTKYRSIYFYRMSMVLQCTIRLIITYILDTSNGKSWSDQTSLKVNELETTVASFTWNNIIRSKDIVTCTVCLLTVHVLYSHFSHKTISVYQIPKTCEKGIIIYRKTMNT